MTVKRHFTLVALLALAGCQTTRYVPTHCVTPDQVTKLEQAKPPKVGDQLTGKADRDVQIIAGSNIRLRAWGEGLMGVLRGCAA